VGRVISQRSFAVLNDDNATTLKRPGEKPKLTVCTGREWYSFPSHFFLPTHAQLAFLNDNFHGLLPQPFAPDNGTFADPIQPFNDRNEEEPSRYVRLADCDYVVLLHSERVEDEPRALHAAIDDASGDTSFIQVAATRVIDPVLSISSFGRAFYIPFFSSMKNKFQQYRLYEKVLI
jgi:alpha-1,2-mannosyltransferase